MFNVQELERKWIRYKLKSYAFPIVILLVITFLIVSGSVFLYRDINPLEHNSSTTKQEQNSTQIIAKQKVSEVNVTQNNETNDDKLILHPSLGFVDNVSNSMTAYYDNNTPQEKIIDKEKTKEKVIPKIQNTPVVNHKPQETQQVEKITPVAIPKVDSTVNTNSLHKQKKVDIQMHSADDDLQDVVQRFKKTNSATLGLFLAKRYYDLQDYNQAYNYALLTNQINSKLDMSWIIFAKSLVKLGKKEMAVNTLKTYIKNSNSPQASTLLDEIEMGRFK